KSWQRRGPITSAPVYNHTSEPGRLQIWSRGVGYVVDNPILGVGPGNFATAEGTLSPLAERQMWGIGVRWNAPHNSYLQIAAELGIPGFLLYVAVIVSAFRALRRATPLTPALTASLIGFVVGSLFLPPASPKWPTRPRRSAAGRRKWPARWPGGPGPPARRRRAPRCRPCPASAGRRGRQRGLRADQRRRVARAAARRPGRGP